MVRMVSSYVVLEAGVADWRAGVGSQPSASVDFTAGVIAGQLPSLSSTDEGKKLREKADTDSAGAAGLLVGQPFDVVKVRYQIPSFNGRYTSTWGALGEFKSEMERDARGH